MGEVMKPLQIIAWLESYGHFRNPAFPDTHNVEHGDLDSLAANSLNDHQTQEAIRSIQLLDANFDVLCSVLTFCDKHRPEVTN